jgi:hypothetical protein
MLELREWTSRAKLPDRPWLVLGKGPTFDRRGEFDLTGYNLMSLNHAVAEQPVDVALAIDLDVVETCGDALERNARWLLLPRHPHVDFEPGPPLEEHVRRSPVLSRLDRDGRLVWYDLATAGTRYDSPLIGARYFVSEAALNVLGEMGARRVRSLGIDGGKSYARTFADLESRTLLANSQPTFDVQFPEIARILFRRGLDYAPLTREAPIRVFVGSDRSQRLAARVLEYSIRKHTSMSVEVTFMIDMPIPLPEDPAKRPRTPFSFTRFLIPKLAGYRGKAIYVDSDMQVFSDLTDLWEQPFDGATVLCAIDPAEPKRRRQYSVLLLDCSRLDWDIDEIVRDLDRGRYTYEQLLYELCIVPPEQVRASLPERWNSLEKYVPGTTCLIHYTDMRTQPYVSRRNPNGHLWVRALRDAVADGFISEDEIKEAVRNEYVRPSLLSEVHPWAVWRSAQDLFYKPHRELRKRLEAAGRSA